jgi:hypothetical protein
LECLTVMCVVAQPLFLIVLKEYLNLKFKLLN